MVSEKKWPTDILNNRIMGLFDSVQELTPRAPFKSIWREEL
jgi:hypothetical protein